MDHTNANADQAGGSIGTSLSSTTDANSPLTFHPLAKLFPLIATPELDELADDIKENGLREPIVLYDGKILDGRNRYIACVQAGVEPLFVEYPGGDPIAYVISKNLKRRHLTAEQKREIIEKLIREQPHKSNRQIAREINVSHPHIGKVRSEMEAAGDVETLPRHVDTRGRRQPAKKTLKKQVEVLRKSAGGKTPPADPLADARGTPAPQSREDIGPNSATETERLRARNLELENEKQRLVLENRALRKEVEELKAKLAERELDIPPEPRRAAP